MSSASGDPYIPALLDERILADLHEDFSSTGDLGELAALIRNFLARGASGVADVIAAVEAGDAEAIRAAGHKLRGSSHTLGANLLGVVAAKVESAGADGDLATAARGVRELDVAFSLTRGALADMVVAIGGGPVVAGSPEPAGGEPAGERVHALLADDEPIALAVLRAGVERLGHGCTAVTDGEAAMAAYERARPQAVITDVHLPGIDGIELARRIRVLDGGAPYVAIVSASGERAAGALGSAVDACLSKPLRENELRAILAIAAQRAL